MEEAVVIDGVRTPIGRYGGVLAKIRPDELAAVVIEALLHRHPSLPWGSIDEVVMGCANQAGEDNRNVARMASLLAGLPVTVSGVTVNRLCGSGLDAVLYGARLIMTGEAEVVLTGGVESMTRAPYVMAKSATPYLRPAPTLYDTTIGWRFTHPLMEAKYGCESMPETAEHVARAYGISRAEQDYFALHSQLKAAQAVEQGNFTAELIPVPIPFQLKEEGDAPVIVTRDEHPRPTTTLEKLEQLPPLFHGGSITAGNAAGINDGAAALLLMSRRKAAEYGLQPMAKVVGGATAGVPPRIMGTGPIPATQKLLKRFGLSIGEMKRVELNEAFAAQALACAKELGITEEQLNPNGGAIALGHPLGASGARILTTLIHQLWRDGGGWGLATMCVGVGQGISLLVKAVGSEINGDG